MAAIMETAFDVLYLATVWILVALMARRRADLPREDAPLAARFLLAFVLLASGDSFHVGFRVLQQAIGPDAAFVSLGGVRCSLLGLGMLATAYTMTGFYMVLAEARLRRSGKRADPAFWIVEILLSLRLIIMALPGNAWEAATTPYAMGFARNLPLAVSGVILAFLFIREGRASGDRAWAGIGWAMAASYAFYAPVILWVSKVPMIGLLMIPKTIAYVAMGLIAYRRYFRGSR